MSELNHNEPSKKLEEQKVIHLSCGFCKASPAQIGTNGLQFGPLVTQVFFCAGCGAIFNIHVTGQVQPDTRFQGAHLIGGGRI